MKTGWGQRSAANQREKKVEEKMGKSERIEWTDRRKRSEGNLSGISRSLMLLDGKM